MIDKLATLVPFRNWPIRINLSWKVSLWMVQWSIGFFFLAFDGRKEERKPIKTHHPSSSCCQHKRQTRGSMWGPFETVLGPFRGPMEVFCLWVGRRKKKRCQLLKTLPSGSRKERSKPSMGPHCQAGKRIPDRQDLEWAFLTFHGLGARFWMASTQEHMPSRISA